MEAAILFASAIAARGPMVPRAVSTGHVAVNPTFSNGYTVSGKRWVLRRPLLLALAVVPGLPGVSKEDLVAFLSRSPLAGAARLVAMVSLAGLPGTAGVFGTVFLIRVIVPWHWALLASALLGTVVGLVF